MKTLPTSASIGIASQHDHFVCSILVACLEWLARHVTNQTRCINTSRGYRRCCNDCHAICEPTQICLARFFRQYGSMLKHLEGMKLLHSSEIYTALVPWRLSGVGSCVTPLLPLLLMSLRAMVWERAPCGGRKGGYLLLLSFRRNDTWPYLWLLPTCWHPWILVWEMVSPRNDCSPPGYFSGMKSIELAEFPATSLPSWDPFWTSL